MAVDERTAVACNAPTAHGLGRATERARRGRSAAEGLPQLPTYSTELRAAGRELPADVREWAKQRAYAPPPAWERRRAGLRYVGYVALYAAAAAAAWWVGGVGI